MKLILKRGVNPQGWHWVVEHHRDGTELYLCTVKLDDDDCIVNTRFAGQMWGKQLAGRKVLDEVVL